MAYEFHYTPTGTGVISGKEVLEQTEDAINDLGNTAISGVQEALDKAEQALTNSENAVDDAQTALNTANNAEGVAIQAQTDVGNLSGTVANIGNRVTTAEGNITNLQGRMTTAEGNITNIQGRMTTAETNIGNLQTAVSTAQATANSAQQTATTARQQSYVFRYSSTAITDNSTIAYSTLDNTDNIKVSDKIIDSDGKIFRVVSIDSANETVTVGTALIDLAQDSGVVHKSGNETVGGQKTFSSNTKIYNSDSTADTPFLILQSSKILVGDRTSSDTQSLVFSGGTSWISRVDSFKDNGGTQNLQLKVRTKDNDNNIITSMCRLRIFTNNTQFFEPDATNVISLGRSGYKWKDVQTNLVNGLTPSSLSLPNVNTSSFVDISGYFTNTGNGDINTYSVTANGWVYLRLTDIDSCQLSVLDSSNNRLYGSTSSGNLEQLCLPVTAGTVVETQWTTSTSVTVAIARFIPCQGNI